jgi:hypothetical protein
MKLGSRVGVGVFVGFGVLVGVADGVGVSEVILDGNDVFVGVKVAAGELVGLNVGTAQLDIKNKTSTDSVERNMPHSIYATKNHKSRFCKESNDRRSS